MTQLVALKNPVVNSKVQFKEFIVSMSVHKSGTLEAGEYQSTFTLFTNDGLDAIFATMVSSSDSAVDTAERLWKLYQSYAKDIFLLLDKIFVEHPFSLTRDGFGFQDRIIKSAPPNAESFFWHFVFGHQEVVEQTLLLNEMNFQHSSELICIGKAN